MKFRMTHRFFDTEPSFFSEQDAPDWLTSCKTVVGSTMDNRWFWTDHVLKLPVGQSINTDYRVIERVE